MPAPTALVLLILLMQHLTKNNFREKITIIHMKKGWMGAIHRAHPSILFASVKITIMEAKRLSHFNVACTEVF